MTEVDVRKQANVEDNLSVFLCLVQKDVLNMAERFYVKWIRAWLWVLNQRIQCFSGMYGKPLFHKFLNGSRFRKRLKRPPWVLSGECICFDIKINDDMIINRRLSGFSEQWSKVSPFTQKTAITWADSLTDYGKRFLPFGAPLDAWIGISFSWKFFPRASVKSLFIGTTRGP